MGSASSSSALALPMFSTCPCQRGMRMPWSTTGELACAQRGGGGQPWRGAMHIYNRDPPGLSYVLFSTPPGGRKGYIYLLNISEAILKLNKTGCDSLLEHH